MLALICTTPLRCAFYTLWRGMHHPWGTTLNRIMYGSFIGCEFTLLASVWHLPLCLGLISMVFTTLTAIIGNSRESQNNLQAHMEMSLMMFVILLVSLIPFIYFYPLMFFAALAGVFGGVGYWLGYRMTATVTIFGVTFLQPGDVSWGELFNGLFTWGAAITLLELAGLYA